MKKEYNFTKLILGYRDRQESKSIGGSNTMIHPLTVFFNETVFSYVYLKDQLIVNTKFFYLVIPHLLKNDSIITTTKTKLSTSSCRVWQLLYIVLYQWFLVYPSQIIHLMSNPYQYPLSKNQIDMIQYIKSTMEIIKDSPLNIAEIQTLHRVIFQNDNLGTIGNDEYFKNIYHINDLDDILDQNRVSNYCLCLNFQQILGQTSSIGMIIHFFTLIRHGDQWYLNSSYGSDYVKVPQYTTPLDLNEFQLFLDFINNGGTNTPSDEFSKLFIKFFLENQKEWYLEKMDAEDICDPWYKCARMLIDLSSQNRELRYLLDNKYLANLKVSWIKPYSKIIQQLVALQK